ncbi:MAG TPA: thrombospondin type 3 repeat-containing protein, partial [Thermoanaerobaculia bacterium]
MHLESTNIRSVLGNALSNRRRGMLALAVAALFLLAAWPAIAAAPDNVPARNLMDARQISGAARALAEVESVGLTRHLITVHTGVRADELDAAGLPAHEAAPAALAARLSGLPLGRVLDELAAGASLDEVLAQAGVRRRQAQEAMERMLNAFNVNTLALNRGLADSDGDGIVNAMDPDVDGDGLPNWMDTDVDGDQIP